MFTLPCAVASGVWLCSSGLLPSRLLCLIIQAKAPFEEGEHKRVQEDEGEREPEEQQQQEGEACPLQELDNEEVAFSNRTLCHSQEN